MTHLAAGLQTRLIGSFAALALAASVANVAQEPIPQPTTSGGCPVESRAFYECAAAKAKTFTPPRTADGHPDFQGYYQREYARHEGERDRQHFTDETRK